MNKKSSDFVDVFLNPFTISCVIVGSLYGVLIQLHYPLIPWEFAISGLTGGLTFYSIAVVLSIVSKGT